MGDWNGDGTHTVGVVRGNPWLLRDENNAGAPDYDFRFGEPGDTPLVGDWNGNGVFGIGVRQADSNNWRLRESPIAGEPQQGFKFGLRTDGPVTSDWNGNGRKTDTTR